MPAAVSQSDCPPTDGISCHRTDNTLPPRELPLSRAESDDAACGPTGFAGCCAVSATTTVHHARTVVEYFRYTSHRVLPESDGLLWYRPGNEKVGMRIEMVTLRDVFQTDVGVTQECCYPGNRLTKRESCR